MISALVRHAPPLAKLGVVLAQFRFDFYNQYQRLLVSDAVITAAMGLAEAHRLRGYDAVQLATALELHSARHSSGLPSLTFISADQPLNAAAQAESLIVDNPTSHP